MPTARSVQRSSARRSTSETARSRSGSRTARCSASVRSTTRSSSSVAGRCASSTRPYAPKLTRADRELDWSGPPHELLNRIRALSPHVGARGELHGRPVTVWKARLDDGRLVPVEVQPDGRRRMSYDEFLRGLR